MRRCINGKVVGALALAGLAVVALAPDLVGAALPLLVVAACPLSMLVMMRGMQGDRRGVSAPAPAAGESGAPDGRAHLARLRAEVDQLRSEQADDDAAPGTTSTGTGARPRLRG